VAVVPYKWIFRRHLEAFIARTGSPESVLEAGCARGKFSERFPDARYVGTTFSEEDLEAARQSLPSREFLFADLGEPNALPGERFSLVVCTHTISYVPMERMPTAVEGLHRSTAQGGHLILQFTAADRSTLVPLVQRLFTVVEHRSYGGLLLEAASRFGLRLGANKDSGWMEATIRALDRLDFGRKHHLMLLEPR